VLPIWLRVPTLPGDLADTVAMDDASSEEPGKRRLLQKGQIDAAAVNRKNRLNFKED
jgi:hypothetical protein